MRWQWALGLTVAIAGCGRFSKHTKNDGDDGKTTVTPSGEAAGNANSIPVVVQPGGSGPAGPAGAAGADGTNGTNGVNGSSGGNGAPGQTGGVVLFDAENRQIGVKLHDDTDGIAQVVLSDHHYAMINRDSGELEPLLEFFCLYEASDCSGACYVYDKRWLNLLVLDGQGGTWVAGRHSPDLGAKTLGSYTTVGGSCVSNSIGTMESYKADRYTPPGLTFPLPAPLFWDTAG